MTDVYFNRVMIAMIIMFFICVMSAIAENKIYGDKIPESKELATQAVLLGYAHWEKEGSHRVFVWNVKPESGR